MTVHGTARFAALRELAASGLLGDWSPERPPEGLMLDWWWESAYNFSPIGYDGDLHEPDCRRHRQQQIHNCHRPLLRRSPSLSNSM
jgi:hypothetical protein